MDQPAWMTEAWRQLGTREVAGRRHSRTILEFFRDAGRRDISRDEVPWCAAFVGACLQRTGRAGTGSLLARSYLDWGRPISQPKLGAVVVLTRGTNPNAGHVGFWLGETADKHILLGGNQSDAVTVEAFDKNRLLGVRWPGEMLHGNDAPDIGDSEAGPALTFEYALAHVLEMEGGYSDDPDDPGGPTNKGVTLEVFCRYLGRTLNEFTRERRISELRAISDSIVGNIYRDRYWQPSRSAELPAGIAIMHFDAAVNHGVTGAARLLQRALVAGKAHLDIDGEIGPLTMAAVFEASEARLLADYAETRRAKYRSLKHFWKFGRGWLNRVGHTEKQAALFIGGKPPATQSTSVPTKGNDMTTGSFNEPTKWWGSSMTIWGAVITALSTVVPILGPAMGLDVTPDVVRQAGEQFVTVIQAIGGLMGTIMTIYGRARATQLLERRDVRVHI